MADKAKKEEAVAEEVAVAQPKQEVSAKEANPEKFLKDFNC